MQDRKDLKIEALLQKIANLTRDYENQVAELRVELTLVSDERNALIAEKGEQNAPEEVSEPAE